MAISTYKTKLMVGTKEIVIKYFPSLLGKRSSLEITTLSDDAQCFIAGVRQQEESFDFLCNYDAEDYTAISALTGAQDCKLVYGDGSGYTWSGEVSVSVNEGDVDSVMEMTVSITPSTVPVWAAKVTA